MLKYKESKLTSTLKIINADSIIKLISDIDCVFVAEVTLSNGSKKYFDLIKENNYYKGRLLFTEEDINYLYNVTLNLILTSSETTEKTNTITLDINLPKIKQTIKFAKSKEIEDIKISIAKLTKRLEDTIKHAPSFLVQSHNVINSEFIKPGMIPVSIDETGRCIFQYPFIDHITEINGQKTVNNAILITAKDIPIEQTDVEAAIKAHTEAIKELNNYMKTISSELKSSKNKIAELEQKLITHTDSSII